MDDKKYTKTELVIGDRDIPETIRSLVTDYYDIFTKTLDELQFLTLEEAVKKNLTESQKQVLFSVVNFNSAGHLSPTNSLIISKNGHIYSKFPIFVALKKLREYDLVRTFNIVEYACFFADYNPGRKPKVKFPEPLNSSFHTHLSYFSRASGGTKASLNQLFKHIGKRGKIYTMPQYSYARVLYKGESLPKRVFPKPDDFIPFKLYDVIMNV